MAAYAFCEFIYGKSGCAGMIGEMIYPLLHIWLGNKQRIIFHTFLFDGVLLAVVTILLVARRSSIM